MESASQYIYSSENNLRVYGSKENPLFLAKDIEKTIKLSHIIMTIKDYNESEKQNIKIKYPRCNGVDSYRIVIVLTKKGMIKLLQKTRKAVDNDFLTFLREKFEIDLNKELIPSVEIKYLEILQKCFKGIKIEHQYMVGNYRIDFYFPEYNIAVECDENNHKDRDPSYENTRQNFIIEQLKCEFIRFDPYDKEFDIFELINRIILSIHECKQNS